LSRQCGILNISETCRRRRLSTGIVFYLKGIRRGKNGRAEQMLKINPQWDEVLKAVVMNL
jgi:hypothetical protein